MRGRLRRRVHPDVANEVADLAVGAGVHAQRSADRSGNPGEGTDAGGAGGRGFCGHRRHVRRGSRFDDDRVVFDADRNPRKLAAEANRHAAQPAVADQHVAAAADRHPRNPPLEAPAHQRREFLFAMRQDQRVGRTADLPRRVRRERLVEMRSVRENLDQRRAVAIGQQRARRLCRREAHARTASERSTRSAKRAATSVTLPAPRNRTSAPARRFVEDPFLQVLDARDVPHRGAGGSQRFADRAFADAGDRRFGSGVDRRQVRRGRRREARRRNRAREKRCACTGAAETRRSTGRNDRRVRPRSSRAPRSDGGRSRRRPSCVGPQPARRSVAARR